MIKILCFFGIHKWEEADVPTGTSDLTYGEWKNSFFIVGQKCKKCGLIRRPSFGGLYEYL